MDNMQKALQMSVAVLLFIIAATTAIFLYTNLMNNAERIMVISDSSSMSTERLDFSGESIIREIKKEEVAMTILDMENNASYVSEIIVNGQSFNTSMDLITEVSEWMPAGEPTYNSIYNSNTKTLIYNSL